MTTLRPVRPLRAAAMGGLASIVLAGVALAPAHADARHDKKRVDASIANTQNDLEDTSASLAQAYAQLNATAAKVAAARSTLSAAQASLADARQYSAQVAQQLEAAKAAQANADAEVARNEQQTQSTQVVVGAIARQTYQDGGLGGLSMTLQAFTGSAGNGMGDISDRVAMVDTVMRFQSGALDQLRTEHVESLASRDHLAAVGRDVARLRIAAVAAVQRATDAEGRAAAAASSLQSVLATQRDVVARFAAQKSAELRNLQHERAQSERLTKLLAARAKAARERAARLRALRAQQAKEARQAAARQAAARQAAARQAAARQAAARQAAARQAAARQVQRHATPANPSTTLRSGGFLSFPDSAPITSGFGMRFHPILHIYRMHYGIDLGVACGTPVRAAADGEVIQTAYDPYGLGRYVVMDNGLHRGVDLATAYGHLSRVVVYGGHVKRGQVIAISGDTGLSSGCHVHFETRDNGVPVNPLTWLY